MYRFHDETCYEAAKRQHVIDVERTVNSTNHRWVTSRVRCNGGARHFESMCAMNKVDFIVGHWAKQTPLVNTMATELKRALVMARTLAEAGEERRATELLDAAIDEGMLRSIQGSFSDRFLCGGGGGGGSTRGKAFGAPPPCAAAAAAAVAAASTQSGQSGQSMIQSGNSAAWSVIS